jgi:hypothetical protein
MYNESFRLVSKVRFFRCFLHNDVLEGKVMKRAHLVSVVVLVFTLGLVLGAAQQAMAADKTVTLEVHGMI